MEKKIQSLAHLASKHFTAYLDEVSLGNGRISKRICIDHPQASAIVPFVSENEIVMVRQYRYALKKEVLEIPAGKLDEGESPEECIRRELTEETGFEAGSVKWVYTYAPAIGYSNELIHIFVGRDLQRIEKTLDDSEISSIEILTLDEVLEMIRDHKIIDSKTIIGLAFMRSFV